LRLRLKAVGDLQSRTEGGKIFQIRGWVESWKPLEPKLRLSRGSYWFQNHITRILSFILTLLIKVWHNAS